ncbi:hypothetical protein SAMN04489731_110298 [Amycolatopsis regifaucium]|nr:hypothetical protein SAMN04489731_110298 [Amycolatopsis regifaucium]
MRREYTDITTVTFASWSPATLIASPSHRAWNSPPSGQPDTVGRPSLGHLGYLANFRRKSFVSSSFE